MGVASVIESLNGAKLDKLAIDSWQGFFVGNVSIENVHEDAAIVRFDVIVPTDELDIGDYIWSSELADRKTDKAVLEQGGQEVPSARVVGIDREGPDPRWTPATANQYRLTFEVDADALRASEPLDLRLRWPDKDPRKDLAIARGT